MEIEQFEETVKKDDFAVGESFWLGNWEFEVVNRRLANGRLYSDEAVFKWELVEGDFIEAIKEGHPQIENPEEFFNRNKDDILAYFAKGFDVLVGECGATYGTLIHDAVDEVIKLFKSEGCGK